MRSKGCVCFVGHATNRVMSLMESSVSCEWELRKNCAGVAPDNIWHGSGSQINEGVEGRHDSPGMALGF